MEAIVISQANIEANHITSDLLERFSNYIDGSPRTIESYTRSLRQFFSWIQERGITTPTREDIIEYRNSLKATHKPNTTQSYIIAVRQFFKWAAQEGILKNVAENIKGAKIDREHKKDALTTAQTKDILGSIDTTRTQGKRDYAIIALAVTGGLRTIELQRANTEDIRTVGDNTVLFIQGKGREEKTEYVKLTPPVEKALRAYIKEIDTADTKAPLFASQSDRNAGGRLTTKSISRLIKNAFINAGYDSDRLTAHSLRHTAVTLALIAGKGLQEVQQFARHSSITTTQIYAHNLDRMNNQCESSISKSIFGGN